MSPEGAGAAAPERPASGARGSARTVLAVALLAVPAGVLAAVGMAGVGLVAVPVLVGCVLGLLGDVPLFLVIVTAVSGVGLYWTEGVLTVAGQPINLSGLHWGLILVTSGVLLLRRRPRRLPRPLLLYGAFLAMAALAMAWTSAPFDGFKQLLLFALPALVAAVVLANVERDHQVGVILAGYWVALAVAVVAAVGISVAGAAGGGSGLRGGVGDRTFAIFLLPLMALALASGRHRSPAYYWVAGLILAVALATLSRTALLVMLLLPLLATTGLRPAPRLLVLALTAVLGLGALQIEAFRERFSGGGSLRVERPVVLGEGEMAAVTVGGLNLSGRGWMWLQVTRHALERPVLGHGTGSATRYLQGLPRSGVAHPHNDYLRVFHDQGAVGVLVVLVFGVGTAVHFNRLHRRATGRRARRLALAAYLATAAYGLIAVTDNPLVYATFFTQNVFVLYALATLTAETDAERTVMASSSDTGRARTGAEAGATEERWDGGIGRG